MENQFCPIETKCYISVKFFHYSSQGPFNKFKLLK